MEFNTIRDVTDVLKMNFRKFSNGTLRFKGWIEVRSSIGIWEKGVIGRYYSKYGEKDKITNKLNIRENKN